MLSGSPYLLHAAREQARLDGELSPQHTVNATDDANGTHTMNAQPTTADLPPNSVNETMFGKQAAYVVYGDDKTSQVLGNTTDGVSVRG